MARALGRLLDRLSDDRPGSMACRCGAAARYAGRRSRTITSALGPLVLHRPWYHCSNCDSRFAPQDRALGLDASRL